LSAMVARLAPRRLFNRPRAWEASERCIAPIQATCSWQSTTTSSSYARWHKCAKRGRILGMHGDFGVFFSYFLYLPCDIVFFNLPYSILDMAILL
jgi:hypothetical protein